MRLLVDLARRDPELALVTATGDLAAHRPLRRVVEDARGWDMFRALAEMLAAADLTPADLEALVATTGPGPLSGTRYGLAIVRALHTATGRPVIGLPSFFGLADPNLAAPQPIRYPLDRGLVATAVVTVRPDGWQLAEVALLAGTHELPPPAFAAVALARAAAAATPGAPDTLAPIYLREPDTRPQMDGLGRPLSAGVPA
jgi:tRNA A37 threonylcarbamoyladenosine modification protein TsaB